MRLVNNGFPRKSLERNLGFLLLLISSTLLFSCDQNPEEIEPVVEVVKFERQSNLSGQRASIGKFANIGDRLYYSNGYNPGFFTPDGVQNQFSFREYDMRFGHAFSEDFTVGVSGNRRSLVILPNFGYSSTYSSFLDYQQISGLPSNYLLQPGWSEVPNFGMNDNFLISSWERPFIRENPETHETVFILELNVVENPAGFGLIVDWQQPILNKIPISYTYDGFPISFLISVFPFEEGWIASAGVAGIETTFKVERDGSAVPLQNQLSRFVLFSLENSPEGELFAASEEGLLFAESGNPFDLRQIATSNANLRFRFIGDQLVAWAGRDQLYEIRNYKNPETIELVELQNVGLEGTYIKDVILYEGKFHVATNSGLFLKDEADFWEEKPEAVDPSLEIGWELTN